MNLDYTQTRRMMAEAIMDEAKAAREEERECSSEGAIKLFQERVRGKQLSDLQVVELFEIVFSEYCRATGSTVVQIGGEDIRN